MSVTARIIIKVDTDDVDKYFARWQQYDKAERETIINRNDDVQKTIAELDRKLDGLQKRINTSESSANGKLQTGVGEYIMSDRETLETAKQIAKQRAMSDAQSKASIWVGRYQKVINHMLSEDVIETIACSVLKVIDDSELEITPIPEGGWRFRSKVVVMIDPQSIDRLLATDSSVLAQITAENRRLREEKAELERKIAALRG